MSGNPYASLTLTQILPVYIGKIAEHWVEVEYQLCGLFARLGNVPGTTADIIFATVGGNKVQRDLVLSIAVHRKVPAPVLAKVKSILRRCSRAAKKRNVVAHAIYVSRDEHRILALKHMSVLDLSDEEVAQYEIDLEWLDAALAQIVKLADDIHLFTEAIGGSHALMPFGLRHKRPQPRPPAKE